jgi:hypothetical protein
MASKTSFKNIKEYLFQNNKTFIIPDYQRGYKWAVIEKDKKVSAVEKLMVDLINAYTKNKEQQYFLQGVTVTEGEDKEEEDKIVLIDGQQRTTTLYLLLWCLKKDIIKEINLNYDIREKSKVYIHSLKLENFDYKSFDIENRNQDIYYFKKAIEQINAKLQVLDELEQIDFCEFLLSKVTILYIVIDSDKATKTFTMMNGSKATMLQEELVKAEMLRRVSLPDLIEKQVSTSVDDNLNDLEEIIAKDWEINALRSRYAREWDKWLYWWNRKEVKLLFGTEKPMGLLLDLFFYNKGYRNQSFNFEDFRALLIENGIREKQKTKHVFKELRDLQKSFEDIFNSNRIYNYLKMSLLCSAGIDDKYEIIKYFMIRKNEDKIEDDYAKWRLVGATHRQITKVNELKDEEDRKEDKAKIALKELSQQFVYQNSYDIALKQLLRLNVEQDNNLNDERGRKFDFSIYDKKSLEHIHPKSKVYHKEEIEKEGIITYIFKDGNDKELGEQEPIGGEWLNRDIMENDCSEHSIGNLLLLDKNENSKFKDSPFERKKYIYFDINEKFKSRNLLHTISVFAESNWTKDEIKKNQEKFIARFKQDYGINN